MAKRKLVIVGIDSVSAWLIERMVDRGHLPNISALMKRGCFARAMSYFPNETGTNWCVIATGAYPMTTGVNMTTHLCGEPLDKFVPGFPSYLCKAEQIWKTANRAGRRCVIIDYPQSYPLNIDNVIHIGEDGRPDNAFRALQEDRAYVTREPNTGMVQQWKAHGLKVELKPPSGWRSVPDDALVAELPVIPGPRSEVKSVQPLHACVWKGSNGAYQRVTIHAEKDASRKLIELSTVGEFSPWILHTFKADGRDVRAGLRAKLIKLSPDASEFHLYFSQIYPAEGFSEPAELAPSLVERFGPYVTQPSRQQVVQGGASDLKTYFEEQEYQSRWLANAVEFILKNEEWDLFIMKWHGSDWTNHLCAFMLDPLHPLYDPARADEGWDFWVSILELGDAIIGKAMEAVGEEDIVAVVSDHGGGFQTAIIPVNINGILEKHGYIKRLPGGGIDWQNTRAWGSKHYVWINLKGRDPQGCVEQGEEFERLRAEIIDLLLGEKNPRTGRHLFRLVCTKEDAAILGVGGDRVGDIFYWEFDEERRKMTREEFEREYPHIKLGTWDWPLCNSGAHTHDPFIIMAGHGLKKNHRSKKTPWLSDFAPTLCYLCGLPAPADADGGVIWDFLE